MDWKKLALCAALSGASMNLVACGGGDGEEPPGPTTYAYVLSTASIPTEPDGDSLPGFNLDGVVSNGEGEACTDVEDWTSPNNGTGVDNNFTGAAMFIDGMVEGGITGALESQIAAGTFLLVMEVSGVDNFTTDSSVMAHLFLGQVEGEVMTAGSRIAPGQTFTVMTEIATVAAAIEGGRITVDDVDLPLSLTVMDQPIMLTLESASISAAISPTGLGGGEIGATLGFDEIVSIAMRFSDAVTPDLVRTVAPPDMDADGNMECEGVSAGLTFESVSARTSATN